MVKKNKTVETKTSTPTLTINRVEEEIKKQVDMSVKDEKRKEKLTNTLKRVFIDGVTPGEAMEFDEEFINEIYSQAYARYNLGLYKDSVGMFRILCILDPHSAKYQMGLAASYHQMQNYDLAINTYLVAWFCDLQSPVPLVYSSDCFIKLNQPEGAWLFLQIAANLCAERPEYAKLKARCLQMMEAYMPLCGKKPLESNGSNDPSKPAQQTAKEGAR